VGVALLDDWEAVRALSQWIPGNDLREALVQRTRERLGLPEDYLSVLPAALPLTDAQAGIFGARFAQVVASTLLRSTDEQLVEQWRQTINTRQPFQAWEVPGGRFAVPFTLPVVVASVVAHDYWWPPLDLGDDWDADFASLLVADMKAQGIMIARLEMESAEPHAQDALAEPIADVLAGLDRGGARQVPMLSREYAVGRNEPCPCGSGKKYKKCCGR
jgi:hypothetical protein